MPILILRLVFWNSKPKSIFWTNLSLKTWILHFAWKLVHEAGSKYLEDVIVRIQSKVWKKRWKWIIALSARCSYIFTVAKSKNLNQSTKECWINGIIVAIKIYLIKKVLLQPKLWNKIKTTYKFLHNGPSIQHVHNY